MDILGVIPARYNSSRFPGKPLVDILGKPLIIHVAEKVEKALGKENFVVATEDERIYQEVEKFGYRAIMTSDKPKTGTDRVWEVAQKIKAKVYLNIQGDEPMLNPVDILNVAKQKSSTPEYVINAFTEITENEDPYSVNIPKVVMDINNFLLYASRMAIPGVKGKEDLPIYYKQVCIYAFSYEELKAFSENGSKTYLESFEDIEILRFLELGYKVKLIKTNTASIAVDEQEDVAKVVSALSS